MEHFWCYGIAEQQEQACLGSFLLFSIERMVVVHLCVVVGFHCGFVRLRGWMGDFWRMVVHRSYKIKLGVWKATFIHLLHILYAYGSNTIQELNIWSLVSDEPSNSIIFIISANSNFWTWKKLAECNFEDLLQVWTSAGEIVWTSVCIQLWPALTRLSFSRIILFTLYVLEQTWTLASKALFQVCLKGSAYCWHRLACLNTIIYQVFYHDLLITELHYIDYKKYSDSRHNSKDTLHGFLKI